MSSPGILLGVPDAPVESLTSWDVNKIGGIPDEMTLLPSVKCAKCGMSMLHVIQVYCPLGLSPFHRVLHVFACSSKSCWNTQHSWRVFRSQLRDSSQDGRVSNSGTAKEWKVAMETSEWCDDADDWGSDEETSDLVAMVTDTKQGCLETNIEKPVPNMEDIQRTETTAVESSESSNDKTSEENLISELEDLEVTESVVPEVSVEEEFLHPTEGAITDALSYLATKNNDGSENSDTTSVFEAAHRQLKPFYLDVFDEPANDMSHSHHVTALLKDYERRERVNLNSLVDDVEMSGGKGGHSEKYEKGEIKHGDKYFHKFMKRLKVCPEQVVRYQYGGQPLPLSQLEFNPTPCTTCHAPRVFEMQLVPPLIPYLKYPGESEPAVEFGTVLVYTCIASCWGEEEEEGETQPREEVVLVQADPDQHLFKM